MNKRQEAMHWWNNLASLQKTQICDVNTELVGSVRRWESLTGREIETLFEIKNIKEQTSDLPKTMLDDIFLQYEEKFLTADGFNDAVIGVDETTMRLIYSVSKCIDILMKDGLNYDDAMEHFNFNISGSYVGVKTPIWCFDTF